MARKKVEFEVILKKHAIVTADNEEGVNAEVQKIVDYNYYQGSDSCEARVTKITDMAD